MYQHHSRDGWEQCPSNARLHIQTHSHPHSESHDMCAQGTCICVNDFAILPIEKESRPPSLNSADSLSRIQSKLARFANDHSERHNEGEFVLEPMISQ